MTMPRAYLITAPTVAVMSAAEVKAMIRVGSATADAVVDAMVGAVTDTIDAASFGWLGRALRPQTWELRLPWFCHGEGIRLPYPPVSAVSSVKYDDASGVEQTLVANTDYRVIALGDAWETIVAPLYGSSWPETRWDEQGSVRIRYISGYPATPSDVLPRNVKSYVALGVQGLLTMGAPAGAHDIFTTAEVYPGDGGSKRWDLSNSDKFLAGMEQTMGGLLSPLRVYA